MLSAMTFSFNGTLLATASEKGTVIRVFCVKNGQKVHEFRRGVKRHVNIGSLNFSNCANYVSASSNTETIHIFKIDPKYVEAAERRGNIYGNENDANASNEWITYYDYFTNVVSDVLYQDRAFASVQMKQPGLKYECVMTKLEKENRLLLACEDGFLYIYDFDDVKGGECKLIRAHDVRTPLHDITGKWWFSAVITVTEFSAVYRGGHWRERSG
jgi:autophagy-related protein 18